MAVAGWHPGEQSIHRKLGLEEAVSQSYTWIDGDLPEQFRVFFTTRLPFIPITTLDSEGRPWTSIAAGATGELGFATSPDYSKLLMNILLIPGDPLEQNVKLYGKGKEKMLIAGIGIEFSTRRRNKFAGFVTGMLKDGQRLGIELEVNQAIGNCPKYINYRDLIPHPDIHPEVQFENMHMSESDRLPDSIINFIHAADTVFIGTSYHAQEKDKLFYPSHVGQNQRGGKPGFVRVRRSDGRTVILPDYSGNRLLTSLGNIESTPFAAYTFVSFTEGHILYLSGDARNIVGEEAQAIMPRQNVITALHVTGFAFVRDALTVRQRPGSEVGRSPYSPPIKLLAEELEGTSSAFFESEISVTLAKVEIHSQDLATFTWNSSEPLLIQPGQTAVLDFKDLLGSPEYSHMAPWNPASINDDRIRTWTVSRANTPPEKSSQFSLTMREKKGGTVTGALFTIARKLASHRPELLEDATPMELKVKLVGIVGEFTLDETAEKKSPKPLLWFAGGIGITPYFAMLTALTSSTAMGGTAPRDIRLVVSTREPAILTELILRSLEIRDTSPPVNLTVDIFTNQPFTAPVPPPSSVVKVVFEVHSGRVDAPFVKTVKNVHDCDFYMCGPPGFERAVLDSLTAAGVDSSTVKQEGFEY